MLSNHDIYWKELEGPGRILEPSVRPREDVGILRLAKESLTSVDTADSVSTWVVLSERGRLDR
jgi:hypothetical protein